MKKIAYIFIILGVFLVIVYDTQVEFRNEIAIFCADGGVLLIGFIFLIFEWIIQKFKKEDLKFWELIIPMGLLTFCWISLIMCWGIGNSVKEDVLNYSNGEVELVIQKFETGITGNERVRCIINKKELYLFRIIEVIQMPYELKKFRSSNLEFAPQFITHKETVFKLHD